MTITPFTRPINWCCVLLAVAAALFVIVVIGLTPLYVVGALNCIGGCKSSSGASQSSLSASSSNLASSSGTGGRLGRATYKGATVTSLPNFDAYAKSIFVKALSKYTVSYISNYENSGSDLIMGPNIVVYSTSQEVDISEVSSSFSTFQSSVSSYTGSDNVTTGSSSVTVSSFTKTSTCTVTLNGNKYQDNKDGSYTNTMYNNCMYTCGSSTPSNSSCITSSVVTGTMTTIATPADATTTVATNTTTAAANTTTAASGSGATTTKSGRLGVRRFMFN